MSEKLEIIPIVIPVSQYNRVVVNLVEHLLLLDDKLRERNPSEVA